MLLEWIKTHLANLHREPLLQKPYSLPYRIIRLQKLTRTFDEFITRHRERVIVLLKIPRPKWHAGHDSAIDARATSETRERILLYPALTTKGLVWI